MTVSTPKVSWLKRWRDWHTWAGLTLALPLCLVGVTGVLLMHKSLVPKWDREGPKEKESAPSVTMTEEQVLQIAHEKWPDIEATRFDVHQTDWPEFLRVKGPQGRELFVSQVTAEGISKPDFDQRLKEHKSASKEKRSGGWKVSIKDLHTGKAFGKYGYLVSDACGLVILFLSGSGVYLWVKPLLIRRQKAARRMNVV
jgi:uncharacterized iron-regulated membrane protein